MAKKPRKKSAAKTDEQLLYHKDGSLWARGEKLAGELHGYWEWYRKDGTRMRSGYFAHGVQCGEWITYDNAGKVYKVTQLKSSK
jgi:antitoxin component YwqK of YwqJK toxin-antitoxin module